MIVASRYGATREIAKQIAARLSEHGHDAAVGPAREAELDGADAVVLGSAIYAGRWMKPARELIEERPEELSGRPLWLFSSGPVGEPPKPDDAEPEAVVESFDTLGARDHAVFAGKLDYAQLGRLDRMVAKALHAQEGDFRDWDAIRAWADRIAAELIT